VHRLMVVGTLSLALLTPALASDSTSSALGAYVAPSEVADHTATYRDAVGEDPYDLPPDISDVTVSLIGGRITFRVGIANLGPGLTDPEFVVVLVNTDRNARTGCSNYGAEVALGVVGDTTGDEFPRFGRCLGSDVEFGVPQGSFRFSIAPGFGIEDPGSLTFSVNASQLGSTSFAFAVGSIYEGTYDDYYDDAGPFSFRDSASSGGAQGGQGSSSGSGISIVRHADVRAEATGPSGARVRYAPAHVRNAKIVSYSKRSGTVFPLGRTVVTISARSGKRVARSKFAVIVADTTPPVIAPLPVVGTNSTDPTRATVTYGPITATDRVDRSVSLTCAPPSGSVVAPGAGSVSCTATDDAGNTSTTAFRVSVPVYTNPMSMQTTTTLQYDSARRLVGATTAVTVAIPAAADGSVVSYLWTTPNGTVGGNGASASWVRQIDATGQVAPGVLALTVGYSSGRTETGTIQFP
jgi:hypothetical protein